MRLTHNMYSLSIYKNYKSVLSENSKAIANISSGKQLNSAKDNAGKIAESESLKMSIISSNAAGSNIQDTNSMIQTYDGALGQMNDNISRLKSLIVQAGNETNEEDDNEKIQGEIDNIVKSINDLAKTDFNGMKMSQATGTSKKTTVGSIGGETIDIPFYDVTSNGLGIDNLKVSGSSKDIDAALDSVDKATTRVSEIRSKYGAIQSRLDGSESNIDELNISFTSAQSSIADADIATESLEESRTKVLIQAAISLIAQGNKLPQDALNILSSVK